MSTVIRKIIVMVICSVLLGSCGSLLKPDIKTDLVELKKGNYQLDKQHATVLFKIDHMGFSKFIGRFNRFDANLSFDPDDFSNSKLDAVVDVGSVDVNNEGFENTLRGSGWFNVDKYPQARFETLSATVISGAETVFSGLLTFRGVTAPLDVKVIFNGGATNILTQKYTIGFEASAEFNRSDYGMGRYTPSIGDKVELEIHVEFQKNRELK